MSTSSPGTIATSPQKEKSSPITEKAQSYKKWSPKQESSTEPKLWLDPDEFELRKRLPPRLSTRKNDVYVTRKTDFPAQLARCQKLLDGSFDEICVHGLGRAVNRSLNLGLQLKRRGLGSLDLDVNTSTVPVTDDLLPLMDEGEPTRNVRFVSAVHIRVFRPDEPVTDY